jgi:hypothetical protein
VSIHRRIDSERVREVLRGAAFDWLELHEDEHAHLADGTIAALATSSNGFVAMAEAAYYEAIRDAAWAVDVVPIEREFRRSVDDVLERCPSDGTPTIYFHVSADDRVLYIGQTIHPRSRQVTHRNQSGWWNDVARIVFREYSIRDVLNQVERDEIWRRRPLHNVAHTRPTDS